MDKRETALREGLDKNQDEIQRWESYVNDNETAIENIKMFSKRLTVDVMVPVGRRAYIPGRLIHTNEILVGHYQDYFSKCSAFTATEICKKRIENGKQHLNELKAEKDLFQNKLEKPHLEGVLPNLEQREIIEEYDEEKEQAWRQEHRKRVKEAKQKEKEERQDQWSKENTCDELIQSLDEEELLRELDEEFSELEIKPENDTKELLKKLMAGEMDLPANKKRIAHSTPANRDDSVHLTPTESKTNVQSEKSIANEITNSLESKFNLLNKTEDNFDDGNESDTSLGSDTPEEIRLIEQQAEYLPHGDRIGFYQYQLQIVDQKIGKRSFTNNKELEEKLQLFRVRDHLEDIIEILEEAALLETDDSQPADVNKEYEVEKTPLKPQKKRILFALEDDTLEFRKNETVAQMMSVRTPSDVVPQRDIIRLDEPLLIENQPNDADNNQPIVRPKTILEKVEENLKTQSPGDVDLVSKIIGYSTNQEVQTLRIHFKHSTEVFQNNVKSEIPSSPADLYQLFCPAEHKTPPTENVDSEKAYVDARSEFLSPVSGENLSTVTQSRSILKNKSAVESERHVTQNKENPRTPQKKTKKPKEEEEYLSAYNKVMSDVIENQISVPDPLPEEKFIDMHTPKKRISRFKQMRNDK